LRSCSRVDHTAEIVITDPDCWVGLLPCIQPGRSSGKQRGNTDGGYDPERSLFRPHIATPPVIYEMPALSRNTTRQPSGLHPTSPDARRDRAMVGLSPFPGNKI
jgi:hypothetical protein